MLFLFATEFDSVYPGVAVLFVLPAYIRVNSLFVSRPGLVLVKNHKHEGNKRLNFSV